MKIRIADGAVERIGATLVEMFGLCIGQDWVSVGDLAPTFVEKLKNNPCFEVEGAVSPALASDEVSIADLRSQADDLGIEYDGRWGAARLQSAIDEALSA